MEVLALDGATLRFVVHARIGDEAVSRAVEAAARILNPACEEAT
ncbi:hypothetical protein ACFQX4_27055 [Roseomonas sp. GCM10028921]